MRLRTYVYFWLLITAALAVEYYSLNFRPEWSVLAHFGIQASPEPGRKISLMLGWAGISLMIIMNIYILRKRFGLMKGLGSLSAFLDFHILCGLLGPTFILFHCNFKVRGLVAISFWSMIISATSGVVGRYVYMQLLSRRKDLQKEAEGWAQRLNDMGVQARPEPVPAEKLERLRAKALSYVGVTPHMIGADGTLHAGTFHVLFASLVGDFRLLIDRPLTMQGLPQTSRDLLKRYALAARRALFLDPFRNIMGYWHAFHLPFAIFMYLAAAIHIAAALVLGVSR